MNAFFMKLHQPVFWMFGLILCGLFFIGTPVVHASTLIYGTITEDTVLTSGNNPYEVGDTVIAEGVTLTIEAGVILKFNNSPGYFDVEGSLVVEGTEEQPVYFTSMHDDSVGGDTNNNGSSTVPARSNWRGITFYPGSSGTINHAVLRYGGYYNYPSIRIGGLLYNDGGTVQITDSVFSDTNFFHIGQVSGTMDILRTHMDGGNYGIVATGGNISIHESTVENAGDAAARLAGVTTVTLVGNTFEGNSSAVTIDYSDGLTLSNSGNTASGNDINGIRVGGTIVADTLWQKDGMPYVVCACGGSHSIGPFSLISHADIFIEEEMSLTLGEGAVIKFVGDGGKIDVAGSIRALGTELEPVYFTSEHDDSIAGDLRSDGSATTPSAADWGHIRILEGGVGEFLHSSIQYGGKSQFYSSSAVYNTGGDLTVENSKLTHNGTYALRHEFGTTTISNSSIHDNNQFGVYNEGVTPVDARNNYWGSPTGPYHESLNPSGTGNQVSNNVLFEPWSQGTCIQDCYSNVLFIPGIMSSRLYEDGDQLWEGDEEGVERLMMNEDGTSNESAIYTRDVIETFDGIGFANIDIYKSFLEDLGDLKTSGDIVDYATAPYDWRLSLSDILTNGLEDESGNISYLTATNTPYIEQTLRRLARESKTGKVTIVTHSNGGLVAKALVNVLGEEAGGLIDRIVFVGVPQLGTPQAIGSLLHGYDAGIPFVLTEELGREFAQNAPTSYQLLPQSDYYNNVGTSISTPLIRFEDGTKTQSFINTYGYAIDSGTELHNFLVGAEGRMSPSYNDLENPAKANATLLSNAEQLLSSIGSSWSPPAGIEVHQVGGVGEYTLAGITYKTIKECTSRTFGICTSRGDKLSYTPDLVIDGDGTVVLPSALAMSEGPSVKRWWVNLQAYNDDENNLWIFALNHKNMLEVPQLRQLIISGLLKREEVLPQYLSEDLPSLDAENRMMFILHSPLALSAHDSDGNMISESISTMPDTQFTRYGEVQVLVVSTDTSFTLKLDGETEGSFTLEVFELEGENISETVTFSAIPSKEGTEATIEFSEGTLESAGPLLVDYDGEGTSDVLYTPVLGGIVTDPDIIEEPNEYTYESLFMAINELDIRQSLKRPLIAEARLAERWHSRESQSWVYTKLEILALRLISRTIERYADRGWIQEDEQAHIENIIEYLENH